MKHKRTYGQKKLHKIVPQEAIERQADKLIVSLQKELSKIKRINAVVLFGSFARGDYSFRHSDIDIMMFIDEYRKNKKLEEQIRKKVIKLTLGKELSIHTLFQYKKVAEEDRSLMLTISREGKVLFARRTIVMSANILGLAHYVLVRFDTTGVAPVVKNKLQRFLFGYKMKGRRYKGIVDEKKILSAGKGAIIVPEEIRRKVLLFAHSIDVKAVQKGKFYK